MSSKYFGGMGYELIIALALFGMLILAIGYGFIPTKREEGRMTEVSRYLTVVINSPDSEYKKEFLVLAEDSLNDNAISGREFNKITKLYNKHENYVKSEKIRVKIDANN